MRGLPSASWRSEVYCPTAPPASTVSWTNGVAAVASEATAPLSASASAPAKRERAGRKMRYGFMVGLLFCRPRIAVARVDRAWTTFGDMATSRASGNFQTYSSRDRGASTGFQLGGDIRLSSRARMFSTSFVKPRSDAPRRREPERKRATSGDLRAPFATGPDCGTANGGARWRESRSWVSPHPRQHSPDAREPRWLSATGASLSTNPVRTGFGLVGSSNVTSSNPSRSGGAQIFPEVRLSLYREPRRSGSSAQLRGRRAPNKRPGGLGEPWRTPSPTAESDPCPFRSHSRAPAPVPRAR